MSTIAQKRILVKFRRIARSIIKRIKEADWTDPLNILVAICVIILPFVAKQYVATAILLGCLLALSILWTISKSPVWIREIVVTYPVLSDFILSVLATIGIGTLFGHGLVLGMGAVICGVIISYCIPNIKVKVV